MISLSATIRETKTRGEINSFRAKGFIPCIIYGGVEKNQKIYINKKIIKNLINSENFLSNKMSLEINGKEEKVLPREISFDPVTDEPLHIDFLRIVNVPTIHGRDFVVATVAAPTVVVEPEKPAEEAGTEGEEAMGEGEDETKTEEGDAKLDEKDKKPGDTKAETKPETKKEPTKK